MESTDDKPLDYDSENETLANIRQRLLNGKNVATSVVQDMKNDNGTNSDNVLPIKSNRYYSPALQSYSEDILDLHGYDSDEDPEYAPPETDVDSSDSNELDGHDHISAESEINNLHIENISKPKTRKRKRNPDLWQCNIRKIAHAAGKEYLSVRKKVVPAKRIKTLKDCQSKCLYKCQRTINEYERKRIFEKYYTLTEQEKKLYLLTTTKRLNVERHRKGKNQANSRRKQTFNYYFLIGTQQFQVCKQFYLSTLAISQTPVYTAHSNKDIVTNIPVMSAQGKHTKHKVSDEDLNFVKLHIESFPLVESHYCRAQTQRKYLDPSLNIKKMYELYTDLCRSSNKQPVKESYYRSVFCQNYNFYFHIPKKDRCDLCEEIKIRAKEKSLTDDKNKEYEEHLARKYAAREEKQKDKENGNTFLVFDLQNVLTCPHAEVSNFYYKSKLNVYNLTAILSSTKQVYCSLWSEALMGRSGNDIASALIKILEAVLADNPQLTCLILWSDSCVPQNKNSLMSFAISVFIQNHPNIISITMKFSTPGHSCNQEIDAVHSCIERLLKKSEYYSPLSLLRLLLKVNSRKPYKIMQLRNNDFKDYKTSAAVYNYKLIPFSQVVALKFTQSLFEVEYKMSHSYQEWKKVCIRDYRGTRSDSSGKEMRPPTRISVSKILPQNKVSAIRSMFKWMPEVDQSYYNAILPK